jgi:hypothetical protein
MSEDSAIIYLFYRLMGAPLYWTADQVSRLTLDQCQALVDMLDEVADG